METIRGEYWIIDGDPNYADGDVGDTNHEGYALDHLRRQVLDAVGIEAGDMYDWDALVQEIPVALNDTLDLGIEEFDPPFDQGDVCDELGKFTTHLALDPEDLAHAFGSSGEDVRDYMGRKHGWIVCQQNRFGVWFLTRDTAKQVADAVGAILEQEGSLCDDSGLVYPEVDAELEIFVASTGRTYHVLWRDLERGDMSALQLTEPVPGPNAQVAAMDRELEHPYYRNKHA